MRPRQHVLWDVGKSIYIYCKAKQDQLTEGSVCEIKWVIILHPPFWEYTTQWFKYNNLLGMYMVMHCHLNRSHGQSRSIVPRFPGSGILVPMWAWLDLCGSTGVAGDVGRHWCWGIPLNSWHGRNSWSLLHLGCQCCRCSGCGLHMWCRLWQCRLCH